MSKRNQGVGRKKVRDNPNSTHTNTRTYPNSTRTFTHGKSKDTLLSTPNTLPTLPPGIKCTFRQREVLELLERGCNLTGIKNKLGIAKSTAREHLVALEKKGLVTHLFYGWRISDLGAKYLLKAPQPSKGGCAGPQKNKHANEFSVNIIEYPAQWNDGYFYMQCLKARDVLYNRSTDQWHLYFDEATVRIYPSKDRMTFWIRGQQGTSYEDLLNDVWDKFVEYYALICNKGFKLDHTVTSTREEFADPQGFFAKLASFTNKKGFRIDTRDRSFWVDFSEGVAEEETDDFDTAVRMEQLAESAMKTKADFFDLDKLIEVTGNLVRIETWRLTHDLRLEKPQEPAVQGRPGYIG